MPPSAIQSRGPRTRNNQLQISDGGLSTQAVGQSLAGSFSQPSLIESLQDDHDYALGQSSNPLNRSNRTINQLSVNDGLISNEAAYVPLSEFGISSYRPEIIFSTNYRNPTESNGSLSDVGKFIDIVYQAKVLRVETLLGMFSNITSSVLVNPRTNERTLYGDLLEYRSNNQQKLEKISVESQEQLLDLQEINFIKQSFQIKTLPESLFKENNLTDFDNFKRTVPKSLRELALEKLQINLESFGTMSDTKILGQMLIECLSSLRGASTNLLSDDSKYNNQINLQNPISYEKPSEIPWNLNSLSSLTVPKNVLEDSNYQEVVRFLPRSDEGKILLLSWLLSKEIRVSFALSDVATKQEIQTNFLINNDDLDPFDNIVGMPGNTIYDSTRGPNSLFSLFGFVDETSGNKIATFEEKYFSQDTTLTFSPGTSFFVDPILGTNEAKNARVYKLSNFQNFVQKFTDTTRNFESAVKKLLFPFPTSSNVSNAKKFLETIVSSVFSSSDETYNLNPVEIMYLGIFQLAKTDVKLKKLLVKYLIILGAVQQQSMFVAACERDLNLPSQATDTRKQVEIIASGIEDRVFEILFGTNSAQKNTSSLSLGKNNNKTTKQQTNVFLINNKGKTYVNFERGTIKTSLQNMTNSNLLKKIIDCFQQIENNATINYKLNDNSGRTVYNSLSASYVVYFLFEIVCSFIFKELPTTAIGNEDGQMSVFGNKQSLENSILTMFSRNRNLFLALEQQEFFIENTAQIFKAISANFQSTKNRAERFFTETRASQQNQNFFLVPQSQLKLVNFLVSEKVFKENIVGKNLISIDSFITENSKELIMSAGKSWFEHKPSNLTKIIGVGIPAGYVDYISNRISKSKLNNSRSFKFNNQDLIKINVFLHSNENPEIIFKPLSFIFDISLFVEQPYGNINLNQNTNFFEFARQNIVLSDYSLSVKKPVLLADFYNNEKYSSLTDQEKESIFWNHLDSFILSSQLNLQTGFQFSEKSFPADERLSRQNSSSSSQQTSLLTRYFKEVRNITNINNVSNNINPLILDEVKLFKFGTESIDNNITIPKIFDRVFSIFVDLEKFEIDVESTNSTDVGREKYQSQQFQKKIVSPNEGRNKFLSRQQNGSLIFDDLMLTVEPIL
jgi:hypothetical protein